MNRIAKNKKDITGIPADCHSCIIDQARSAARFAKLAEDQTRRVIKGAKANIKLSKTMPLLAQHIVRSVADTVPSIWTRSLNHWMKSLLPGMILRRLNRHWRKLQSVP